MKRWGSAVATLILIAGCAPLKSVPDGYSGPKALVTDSREYENRDKAAFFVLAEINGKPIDTSLDASRRASYGKGFNLSAQYIEREVPAEPMKVKLIGTHQTGAPIHELFSRAGGYFQTVEGVVDFAPRPNVKYIVKGELGPDGSSVWIEVLETGQRVTDKVLSK
jgi:hypothetical protein